MLSLNGRFKLFLNTSKTRVLEFKLGVALSIEKGGTPI